MVISCPVLLVISNPPHTCITFLRLDYSTAFRDHESIARRQLHGNKSEAISLGLLLLLLFYLTAILTNNTSTSHPGYTPTTLPAYLTYPSIKYSFEGYEYCLLLRYRIRTVRVCCVHKRYVFLLISCRHFLCRPFILLPCSVSAAFAAQRFCWQPFAAGSADSSSPHLQGSHAP